MDLRSIPKDGFKDLAAELGCKPYVGQQIYQWIFQHGVTDFDAMTNLSKTARAQLAAQHTINTLTVQSAYTSTDGTTKYLLGLPDGKAIETVDIPIARRDHAPRRTICISTQVGCAMGCAFCRTATMGLLRNLTQGEILSQILTVKSRLSAGEKLSNIVLMGMGEPLHNYDALVPSLRIMNDDVGLGFGKRKITLSTVGFVPGILKLAEEKIGVKLALSLHATTDEQRKTIMPMAKKYSIEETLDACHTYCKAHGVGTRVTFEYLLLQDVNDSRDDALRLVKLASKVPSKVNVIPWNEFPGTQWHRPSDERIEQFCETLRSKNVQVNVRISRGRDVLAACGQLALEKPAA